MSLVNIDGFNQYKKDTSSGGVVNTDKRSYENYMTTRTIAMQKSIEQKQASENISSLQSEINTMKSDLNDIKNILAQLLEKGK